MNITRENTGEHTATVSVELASDDYQPKVEEMLRDYRKKASIPGFRPGKVPHGVVRKMYGKSVLIEEVNKAMADAINKYVEENNLDLFGYPLLNMDKLSDLEWEENAAYTFSYDIALVPALDITIDDSISLTRYKIVAEEQNIEEYLLDIRKRYGKITNNDVVGDDDIAYGQLAAIAEKVEPEIKDIQKFVPVNVKSIDDKDIMGQFIGKKSGDVIEFDIRKAFPKTADIASMFDIAPDAAEKFSGMFSMTIKEVVHIEPAELGEELYAKVFPGADIKDEDGLRDRIKEDIEATYSRSAEHQLFFDAVREIKAKYPLELPQDYLKRWLLDRNQGEMTADDIEKGFEYYAEELKWQILENKIIEKYELKVQHEEVRQYIKELIGMGNVDDSNDPDAKQRIDRIVATVSENKDEVRRIYENLYNRKLTDLIQKNCKLVDKSLTYMEFTKLVSEN